MVHPRSLSVAPSTVAGSEGVLSADALDFLSFLHHRFEARRQELLAARRERQQRIDAGEQFDFLPETRAIREGDWQVAPPPPPLQNRRVEITGPAERKMMINALNSGANVFMADFEDALSPTWQNVVAGQVNLQEAVRGTLAYDDPSGKRYRLEPQVAVLMVRPRGWHLDEHHLQIDGTPISASLFDFGLAFFHNAMAQLERGLGPYFYLPKLESHREARLWSDVFSAAEDALGLSRGTIRATVLIETFPAAFEMEEILYELREHVVGLNAGRWDYLFSVIKTHRARPLVLPDRAQLTMTVPFMRAYTRLLVQTCHRRGDHAIGGMAAFVPSRRDPSVNALAFARVREDKDREASDGFDGTWVAHPDLVAIAREAFDRVLGEAPHQKHRHATTRDVSPEELRTFTVPGGQVTAAGARMNISVALQYLSSWLGGTGAVAINNLMEDTATAEICRAQLWQWIHRGAHLADGTPLTAERYRAIHQEERAALGAVPNLEAASTLLDELVLSEQFCEFLTLPAYRLLLTQE
ncbi:MAG: malate synthase [Dehalococcoidia bacterium]|nr:MAG: malate synthase [Dehalococcoidia bacterium]